MDFLKKHWACICLLAVACLLLYDPSISFAAGSVDTKVVTGSGGAQFNSNLESAKNMAHNVAVTVSTIMICLGGLMVAMNVDGPNKLLWNSMLGIGLALGFATFLGNVYSSYVAGAPGGTSGQPLTVPIPVTPKATADDIKGIFTGPNSIPWQYAQFTIHGADSMIIPACKILLVLTTINCTIKIALDMITGDKIKYLTEKMLETGVYLALITQWYGSHGMNLMGSLISGFEQLGITASGINTFSPASNGAVTDLGSGDIFKNAYQIINYGWGNLNFGTSPVISLVCFIILLFVMILLFLTGIEMLMARFEFWTMAMLTVPLLGFAGLPQTKFLFESALKAMLSLAVKTCVIAFLGSLTSTIMMRYVQMFESTDSITGDIPLLVQCFLMALLMFILTKQIPQMVQGLLSGNPSISGASMTSIAKQGMNAGAKAGAAVASGGASVAGAAMHGAAAGAGFKAAGGGGSLAKLGGALKGGLNGAAGAMAQGTAGLAKNAILGSNNNNSGGGGAGAAGGGGAGGRSGGLGIVNAMRQGAQLGKNFSTKDQDGQHMGLFGMSDGKGGKTPSVMGNFKDSIKHAISKPETKDVVDMKTTMAKDANGKDVQVQTPQYNADGSMKTHKEETGQFSGIYGAFQNLGKTYRGAKQSSQSDKSTKEI